MSIGQAEHPSLHRPRRFKPPRARSRRLLFRLRGWILAGLIVLWIAAAVATHLRPQDLPNLPANPKLLHALGYFVLGGMFTLVLTAFGRSGWRRDLLVLAVMTTYAAFDEGTQPLFHRHGQVADWLLDSVSAAAALVAWNSVAVPTGWVSRRIVRQRESQRKIQRYLQHLRKEPPEPVS